MDHAYLTLNNLFFFYSFRRIVVFFHYVASFVLQDNVWVCFSFRLLYKFTAFRFIRSPVRIYSRSFRISSCEIGHFVFN